MNNQRPAVFKEFIHLFELHQLRAWNHPWEDGYRLTNEERKAVVGSMLQFQLGESSDGAEFIDRAKRFSAESGDNSYVTAVEKFIAEENRHSELLGRFLAQEGVAPLKSHWLDFCFRVVRRLSGAGTMAATLVTAEIIARPYYRALRGATRSPLLKSICSQILAEEDTHIRFQAAALACIRYQHSVCGKRGVELLHRALLEVALTAVWKEHRSVFIAGNYSFSELRAEAVRGLDELNGLIETYQEELEGRMSCMRSEGVREISVVGSILDVK